MILVGYATTCDAALDGYIFAPGAIDFSQEVPLYYRHERPIGRVLTMQYHGERLLVTAETDDPIALKTDFMSPAAQVLELNGKRVTRARLTEISLTGTPANEHCRVISRSQHDPLREFWRAQTRRCDLTQQLLGVIGDYGRLLVATTLAAAAPQPEPPMPPARGSFSELAATLRERTE
jgi:hypothetical protein